MCETGSAGFSFDVALNYRDARGRATFLIKSAVFTKLGPRFFVRVDCVATTRPILWIRRNGFNDGRKRNVQNHFLSREVETCLDNCRLPLHCRNVTLKDVIGPKLSGFNWIRLCRLPAAGLRHQESPLFYLIQGNGFFILLRLWPLCSKISWLLWAATRRDWINLCWIVGKTGICLTHISTLPRRVRTKHVGTQSAEVMAIPGLRPNYLFKRHRLTSVRMI